jgi:phosphopantetheinyl transferase
MVLFIFNVNNFIYSYKHLIDKKLDAEKFICLNRRNTCIISFLLKVYLIKYLKLNPNHISLKTNNYGKPYLLLDNNKILNFNISHDKDYVVLFYHNNNQVGIDILNYEKKCNINLLKNILHPKEKNYITSLKNNECEQKKIFIKMWCFKEAYLKLLGTGIVNRNDLKNIALPFIDQSSTLPKVVDTKTNRKLLLVKDIYDITKKCFIYEYEIDKMYNICITTLDKINLNYFFLKKEDIECEEIKKLLLKTYIDN